MKTKGTFFSIVLLMVSTFVFAGGNPSSEHLAVINAGDGLFKVIYKGESDQPITLNLMSPEGSLIYSRKVKSLTGFICPVNFKGMQTGTYKVSISQGQELATASINYGVEAPVATYAQIRTVSPKKYAVLVPHSSALITVAIYDAWNNMVISYQERAKGSFGKVFDLSKVRSSSYTFVVSDGAEVIQTKTL